MKTTTTNRNNKKQNIGALVFVIMMTLLLAADIKASADPVIIRSTSSVESFSASCTNYTAVISWNAISYAPNSMFTIERTQDGVHFETVATINAANENEKHEYSIIDNSPLNGVSYYRISETNFLGTIVHLNTIAFTPCENEDAINVSVENNKLFINVNSLDVDTCTIVFKGYGGKVVASEKHRVLEGMNAFNIDVNVPKGLYVLEVHCGTNDLKRVMILESSK